MHFDATNPCLFDPFKTRFACISNVLAEVKPGARCSQSGYVVRLSFAFAWPIESKIQSEHRWVAFAPWVAEKTKYYGKKAYTKVHDKVSSGELKEDAKKAADKVGETAKAIWGFIKTKVDEVKKPNEKKQE